MQEYGWKNGFLKDRHLGSCASTLGSVDLLTLQVVVVGVERHSPVEEGPGEVVDGILLVLNCLGYHFCVEVVVEEVIQVGLGEREEKEGGGGGGGGGGQEWKGGSDRGTWRTMEGGKEGSRQREKGGERRERTLP